MFFCLKAILLARTFWPTFGRHDVVHLCGPRDVTYNCIVKIDDENHLFFSNTISLIVSFGTNLPKLKVFSLMKAVVGVSAHFQLHLCVFFFFFLYQMTFLPFSHVTFLNSVSQRGERCRWASDVHGCRFKSVWCSKAFALKGLRDSTELLFTECLSTSGAAKTL